MISFASAAALRSRSLKSGAFLSSLVVYASSSNAALTPNSFSLTANWSQVPLPEPGPNVSSSTLRAPGRVGAGPGPLAKSVSSAHACSSRSRRGTVVFEMSVSVLKPEQRLNAMHACDDIRKERENRP